MNHLKVYITYCAYSIDDTQQDENTIIVRAEKQVKKTK